MIFLNANSNINCFGHVCKKINSFSISLLFFYADNTIVSRILWRITETDILVSYLLHKVEHEMNIDKCKIIIKAKVSGKKTYR